MSTLKRGLGGALLLAALVLPIQPSHAQTPATTAPAPSLIDPAAIAAATAMGKALGRLKSFGVTADTATELVLKGGQKIQIDGTTTYQVRRPDRLKVEVKTDLMEREYLFDGTKLIVYSPKEKMFGEFSAKPTIDEALADAAKTYGLELPFTALLAWQNPDVAVKNVKEAFRIGTSDVNGRKTTHWGFSGTAYDWEIWLGADNLPLKFSVVDALHPAAPRYVATLNWKLARKATDAAFRFVPPAGAQQIKVISASEGAAK